VPEPLDRRGIALGRREVPGHVAGTGEEPALLVQGLAVEPDVVGDDGRAGAHRPQERGIGAADGVAVQVGVRVEVEGVQQLLVVDAAHEADARIARRGLVDLLDVARRVGSGSDDHERQAGVARPVALHDLQDVVLRLEARDDEMVAVGGQSQLRDPLGRSALQDRRAVADQLGRDAELPVVVVGDARRVGDEGVRPPHAVLLGEPVVRPPTRAPLRPLPLQTVHVERDGDAARPQDREEGGVRGVEDERGVGAPSRDGVEGREAGVAQGLQLLLPQRRQMHHLHAEELGLAGLGSARVDRDAVAAVDQAAADLLDGGLEPAVGGGDAPRADHGDAQ
jgi:hypothetical protein